MTATCPLCGKEVKNYHYLGQHIDKKDDPLHNNQDVDQLQKENDTTENIMDEWETDKEPADTSEKDSMKLNEVETPDQPADAEPETDNWEEIAELDAENFTKDEIRKLKKAMKQGYEQYNPETGDLK